MDFIDLKSKLRSKGRLDEDRSQDHFHYYLFWKGHNRWVTKISHGSRGQIDDEMVHKIARQMRLTKKELRDFVSCPLSREEWLKRREARNPYQNHQE